MFEQRAWSARRPSAMHAWLLAACVFGIFGLSTTSSAALQVQTLLTATGEAAGDQFGTRVMGIGDLNGDGHADFAVGATGNSSGGESAGRVYVFWGGPLLDSVADLTLTGAAYDRFGSGLAGIRDVNADGFDDLLVGAVQIGGAQYGAGRAFVYFGGPLVDAVPDLVLNGELARDQFGGVVAALGDINADGFNDFMVGAPWWHKNSGSWGRTYVYYGGPGLDATADMLITGAQVGDELSVQLNRVPGDLNNDGFNDVILGAYKGDLGGFDSGQVHVYYGGPAFDNVADLTFAGLNAIDWFSTPALAGDLNADGFVDLAIGASRASNIAGRVYVYFGAPVWDTTPDMILTGEAPGDLFYPVTAPGDVNGDGWPDFVVGASGHGTGGVSAGRAYVYLGGPAMDAIPDLTIDGTANDLFGQFVAPAGDLNGDGVVDFAVGAPGDATLPGTAYVFSVVLPAFVDIKPGSCPNPINTKSQGVTPVALLGTDDFDVMLVDPSTLRLEGVEPERMALGDVGTPLIDPDDCECSSAGADGLDDLVLKFQTQHLAAMLSSAGNRDLVSLTLTGRMRDGVPFSASDCVRVIDNSGPIKGHGKVDLTVMRRSPLSDEAEVSYTLPTDMAVKLSVIDVSGRFVARLVDGTPGAGTHIVTWRLGGLPSGVYFVRLTTGGERLMKQFALTR